MEIREILNYLFGRDVPAEPITVGAGGAKLWKITYKNQRYVLKHAHPSFSCDPEWFEGYHKEFEFYKLKESLRFPFLPNIIHAELHGVYGILLLMDCYESIPHEQWTPNDQMKAVDLCARMNSLDTALLSGLNLHFCKTVIDRNFTEKAYEDWKFVFGQHRGRFDEALLNEIYRNIDMVCPILNAEPYYVCHGDFHPDNLLTDGEQLYICDWQNLSIGKCIGDISFFLGRGIGFGIPMEADELLNYYCTKLSEYMGTPIDKTTLLKEKYASTVLTTLSFWAHYLRDCSAERVAVQFDDMVTAYKYLCEH
ncbi:MAG: aminoglycoside phosphotransferase family protein [Clostridia bacterium]|nr:aminoglycoside phosphotransferase family protein [Clostridia bacterium]MBQ9996945.1 aminoglycoside phosphotransferase family protein [Clostridia bacterium]